MGRYGARLALENVMFKRTLTAAALAGLLASPVFAQTGEAPKAAVPSAPPETKSEPIPSGQKAETLPVQSKVQHDAFVATQHATDWRGAKLIGATVYGSDNASIGEITDILISNDGKVLGAVIGVGGFLGVGEKNVAIPLDALTITRKPESSAIDKISVSFSKDDLKKAPTFAYFEPAASRTTGASTGNKLESLNSLKK
jgi:hypothetical protein